MDAKVMVMAILFAVFLASPVSSAECDGDNVVRPVGVAGGSGTAARAARLNRGFGGNSTGTPAQVARNPTSLCTSCRRRRRQIGGRLTRRVTPHLRRLQAMNSDCGETDRRLEIGFV
ncbi:hypothetical protein PVAP13_1KG127977 [Panicum virgatum]|uniref:Uncharacterized protein n=1 Tax=Panicum virgatum TaxID=38727 RepID=A0A8T0X607_PANVG|nr:hypothetical protein PVAP13_1KG127977 [Panicum virgatum]